MMNLMPYGVEHKTPKTVFRCAKHIATVDAARRLHDFWKAVEPGFTVFGVFIDKIKFSTYPWRHGPRTDCCG